MSGEYRSAPTKVVGIKLSEQSLVPLVIVKAAGEQAQQLIREAHNKGEVPIVRAPNLVPQLYRIPIDQAVTPDLFPMMAALLAHVIQIDKHRHNEESAT